MNIVITYGNREFVIDASKCTIIFLFTHTTYLFLVSSSVIHINVSV